MVSAMIISHTPVTLAAVPRPLWSGVEKCLDTIPGSTHGHASPVGLVSRADVRRFLTLFRAGPAGLGVRAELGRDVAEHV